MTTLTEILRSKRRDIALVIGNGIHRYGPIRANSWDALLIDLAHRHGMNVDRVPEGASATEFFDVLDLHARTKSGELALAFCELMRDWQPFEHHIQIMRWASRYEVPVLTTNFDEVLSNAADARLVRPKTKGFTDFYPWDSRFARAIRQSLRWFRCLAHQRHGSLCPQRPPRTHALYGISPTRPRVAALGRISTL